MSFENLTIFEHLDDEAGPTMGIMGAYNMPITFINGKDPGDEIEMSTFPGKSVTIHQVSGSSANIPGTSETRIWFRIGVLIRTGVWIMLSFLFDTGAGGGLYFCRRVWDRLMRAGRILGDHPSNYITVAVKGRDVNIRVQPTKPEWEPINMFGADALRILGCLPEGAVSAGSGIALDQIPDVL
jgi:hypothetical protein